MAIKTQILGYVIEFGGFAVFFLFYLFAWYFDKRFRLVSQRVRVKPIFRPLLHFKGCSRQDANVHSVVCVCLEAISLFLILVYEFLYYSLKGFLRIYGNIHGERFIGLVYDEFLAFFAMIFGCFVIVALAIYFEFRKRINLLNQKGIISTKKSSDFDKINFTRRNSKAWAAKGTSEETSPAKGPYWMHNVVDFDLLEEYHTDRTNLTVKIGEEQNETAEAPDENVKSLESGKKIIESTPVLSKSEPTGDIPVDTTKYSSVEAKTDFASELSIESGKRELKAMTDLSHGKKDKDQGSIDPAKIAGFKKSAPVKLGEGNVINGQLDEIDPVKKMQGSLPGDKAIVKKLKKQDDILS